ncbi:unnamed protein product, partial [Phaeothamnion confervicola]
SDGGGGGISHSGYCKNSEAIATAGNTGTRSSGSTGQAASNLQVPSPIAVDTRVLEAAADSLAEVAPSAASPTGDQGEETDADADVAAAATHRLFMFTGDSA